jgi:hypothetical protein
VKTLLKFAEFSIQESISIKRRFSKMDLVESEYPEISRTATELGVSPNDISMAIISGDMVQLNDDLWSRLENTDSYDVNNMQDFRNLSDMYGKDYRRIMAARPEELPPPVIVEYKPGKYHLVAGNTRLMWMRVKGITPVVVIGRLKNN